MIVLIDTMSLGSVSQSAFRVWILRAWRGSSSVGAVADVVLWRRKEVSGGMLAAVVASWALFYCVPGYTLLSFVSQVLMILLTVLFLWAKAAQLLNR